MFEFLFVIAIIVLILVIVGYENSIKDIKREKDKVISGMENMWKKRVDNREAEINARDAAIKTKNEKIENLEVAVKDTLEKLDNEYRVNETLKGDIIELNTKIAEFEAKRAKVKEMRRLMPKRPVTKDKKQIEQYVKDYLTTAGIDYKLINKSNSLLSVYGGRYSIYCGTESYLNKETNERKHGLKAMVKEIKRLGRKETRSNEKR